MPSKKVTFVNSNGYELSARLEFPLLHEPDAYAVFAHAFTGSKSLKATRNISRSLTLNGIAVLRFDFTGLGDSEGDFSDTNFTSNVEDVIAACNYLKENHEARFSGRWINRPQDFLPSLLCIVCGRVRP